MIRATTWKWEGKTALITGAGGGIGRSLALALAERGCDLALVDVDGCGMAHTRALLEPSGVRVSEHRVDVRDAAAMMALASAVEEAHGRLDLLVNNAGITINRPFAETPLADLHRVVDVSLRGVMNGCHAMLPLLRRNPRAQIVNLASMAAFAGIPRQAAYGAAKAAVQRLSESLRAELAPDGVGVTVVSPGAVRTGILRAAVVHGSDHELTTRIDAQIQRFGMSPDALARRVVRAVERNSARVVAGADARILVAFARWCPAFLALLGRVAYARFGRPDASGGGGAHSSTRST